MKLQIICLVALVILAQTAKVFDLAGSFKNYTCMKNLGYEHSIIRAYHSYGAIDTVAADNIHLSNLAGLSTDVYMFPCRGKNATLQVTELIDYLDSLMKIPGTASRYEYQTGTIWLDIETNPSSGCTWNQGTGDSNCLFVKEIITAIEAKGRAVGIYATAYMWNQIMGSKDTCDIFSKYPLWYAHYDGKENFDDWPTSKFGGWTTPTIKQFAGSAAVCGFDVDLSYY
jgi:hypothetical protein